MPRKSLRQPPHVESSGAAVRSAAGIAALAVGAGALVAAPVAGATASRTGQTARSAKRHRHAVHAGPLYGLLARGAHGAPVRKLQHGLHIKATGRYGAHTRRAVVRFQRRHHLLADGVVGQQTWDKLFHITAPAPPVASSTVPATATASTYTSGGYSIPASIVQCESGGNYSAVNPSSGAGGAYQILPSTWAAYGGQGLPQDASPGEQSAIAAKIYAAQGPSAWSC